MTETQGLVLVAEDDRAVRDAIERALTFEGYTVVTARDGAEALQRVLNDRPDLLLLDVMMPLVDGFEACRRLRASGNSIPVLMLTARTEVSDRVEGLDAGADDYLAKPFALEELLARMRALLRRSSSLSGEMFRVDDLTLDPDARIVARNGDEIPLTKTEFDLLELLVENSGVVMSREKIYEHIWGYDFETTSNSLDVYIGYLRRKTEADGRSRIVHTVRGVGYVARQASS
ncbi:MAG: response regulator transcription factor [bacterium]|nr:response regulator transcription factor [bacterium]